MQKQINFFGCDVTPIICINDISKYEKRMRKPNVPSIFDKAIYCNDLIIGQEITSTITQPLNGHENNLTNTINVITTFEKQNQTNNILSQKNKVRKSMKKPIKNKTGRENIEKWIITEEKSQKRKKMKHQQPNFNIEETAENMIKSLCNGSDSTTSIESCIPTSSADNAGKSIRSNTGTNLAKSTAVLKQLPKENRKKHKNSKQDIIETQGIDIQSNQLTTKGNKQFEKATDETLIPESVPKVNKQRRGVNAKAEKRNMSKNVNVNTDKQEKRNATKSKQTIKKSSKNMNLNANKQEKRNTRKSKQAINKSELSHQPLMDMNDVDNNAHQHPPKSFKKNVLQNINNTVHDGLNLYLSEVKKHAESKVRNKNKIISKAVGPVENIFAESFNRSLNYTMQRDSLIEQCTELIQQCKPASKGASRTARTLLSESILNNMDDETDA